MMLSDHSPNPFDDPVNKEFLENFFRNVGLHRLDTCTQLLNEHEQMVNDNNNQYLFSYCRAIIDSESNHWDQAVDRLHLLLQKDLHPQLHMRALNVVAIAYEHLGRLSEAIELYNRVLALSDKLNDSLYWAKVAKNRAICTIRAFESGLMSREQLLSCRKDLEKTIHIFQEAGDQLLEEGRSWNELGAIYKTLSYWNDALACYRKDLSICEKLGEEHGIAASLNNIGEALIGQGKFDEAEPKLARSVEIFADNNDPFEQADALKNWGLALAGQSKGDEAKYVFGQAIRCVETVRSDIDNETARADFFSTQTQIYGAQVDHCLAMGDIEEAFHVTERARSRGMLELLGRSHSELEITPLTATTVCAQLPSDTAICAYFAVDKKIVGFVLSRSQGISTVVLDISASDLQNGSLDSHGHPRSLLPNLPGRLSKPWLLFQLYNKVLAPLLEKVATCTRLVIIPHGPLHWLPLHAAYNQDGGWYLCEKYDVLYALSATIQMTQTQQRRQNHDSSGILAVACADPTLIHVENEARAIAQIGQGLVLTGPDATVAAILQHAEVYRYLHLAGHAHFQTDVPLLSGVDLADGRLTAEQLLEMSFLDFSLAWINGCDSGKSLIRPDDELLGLTRALLYAVAPSLLLTLWSVHDLSARIFAHVFYTELARSVSDEFSSFSHTLGKTISRFRSLTFEDVRQILSLDGRDRQEIDDALLRLPKFPASIQETKYPFDHPYFWAAYTLIGEVWIVD